MKLENAQIEIKNKEHYEAVKKRCIELIKDNDLDFFESYAKKHNYKIIIYIHNNKLGGCGKSCSGFIKSMKVITLDDLYEVEKEKVIKEMFDVYHEDRLLFSVERFGEAENWIKHKAIELGEYSIRKTYNVVEE